MEPELIEIEGTWEEIAAHASRFSGRRLWLPEEEWAKLPPDLGDHLDHYVYGTPIST